MFSLLLLIAICVGYYYLHMHYPREDKEHIYFGIFVTISIVLIYLFNFEQGLIYRIFHNINDELNRIGPHHGPNAAQNSID